jgi:16S rRNA (guanine966-N2)-methyltransferase
VREALFSSLYSLRGGFEGAQVLDAFAGSGALGIEALSRGAQRAVFYERDAKAAAVVKRNLEACGLGPDSAIVCKRDVLASAPTGASPAFDLVFLDPPYQYDANRVLAMVAELRQSGALESGAIVVYEHDIKHKGAVAEAAEQAQLAAGGQGQKALIFQQHHALCRGPEGQGDMLRRGGHVASLFQRKIRLIVHSCPLFHGNTSCIFYHFTFIIHRKKSCGNLGKRRKIRQNMSKMTNCKAESSVIE